MNHNLFSPRKFLSSLAALPVILCCLQDAAFGFLATEKKVSSTQIGIVDNEYDQRTYQTAWQTDGLLYVMDVDQFSGDFLHSSMVQLDSGVAGIPGLLQGTGTGNGPEWIWSATGSEILYTKALGPDQTDYEVYRAVEGEAGWTVGPLPDAGSLPFGSKGFAPSGTFASPDKTPRVSQVFRIPNTASVAYAWRNLDNSDGAQINPPAAPTNSGRWQIGDNNYFSFLLNRLQIPQVFLYSVATRSYKQLTFDALPKKDPFVLEAPEYPGQRIMMTVVDETNLSIYLEDANGNWNFVNNVRPPTRLRTIRSAEPYRYNGQIYVEMVAENGDGKPSEIWIAGIRTDIPFYREVSNHSVQMERNDPEFLTTTGNGLVVYFTKHGAGTIYRCLTGLGLPVDSLINGTAGIDTLVGTAASERIVGLTGADTLTGGLGKDHFVMDSPSDGVDTITDFTVGSDVVDLHLIMAKFGYKGNSPLTDGYIRVQASELSTDSVIRVDGDGNGTAKTGTKIFLIKNVPPATMNNVVNFIY